MQQAFTKSLSVRWSDCDPNGHVRHSAYYDYGAHARIRFFAELGFDASSMRQLKIGPILFKESCSFIREIRPEESLVINLKKGTISKDGARWTLYHEIFDDKGQLKAHISIQGAWLDLVQRKLTTPPAAIATALHSLQQGEEFEYKKS